MFKFIELLKSRNKVILVNLAKFISEANAERNILLLTIPRNQPNDNANNMVLKLFLLSKEVHISNIDVYNLRTEFYLSFFRMKILYIKHLTYECDTKFRNIDCSFLQKIF